MTPEEVQRRLRTGEDSRTEFKSVRAGPLDWDNVAKDVVAFANSGGGDVLFGVEDDASVTGVGTTKDADLLQRRIVQLASDAISPPLRARLLVVEVEGQLLVLFRVPGYLPGRPFRGRSKYFVRDGPTSREARRDELQAIFVSAGGQYFDEQPIEDAKRTDLDGVLIERFLKDVDARFRPGQEDTYLRAIAAVADDGTPTVTGVLLFCRDPQRFLVDAYVSAIRFPGTSIGRQFEDKRNFSGPLTAQLEDAVAFLARHVSSPGQISGTRRQDQGLPKAVWREAVTNALCHRDYNVTSQTIIYVFDDRVEIMNPGSLLNRLTIDGIRLGGVSQRRNPHVAAALERTGHVENVGMGVPEMIRLVTERGYPEPELELRDGQFRLTVRTSPGAQ